VVARDDRDRREVTIPAACSATSTSHRPPASPASRCLRTGRARSTSLARRFATSRSTSFDALAHATTFVVNDNRRLPTCEVLALFARVQGEHGQSGNDDDTTWVP
jgi:hypothetical protein